MTHELILTSVAQGLDPNERGFCPVAVDSAITPRIYQHLLTLNSYRHLSAASGESHHRNPTAYSHLILPGGIEHVLSRVADAGIDYQHQPNILAHHIVIDGMEAPPESPGWLLALPNFHFEHWDAPPLRFVRARPIPTLTTPPSLTRRQQIARQYHWIDPLKMAPLGSVDTESEEYRAAIQSNDEQIVLAAQPTTPCPVWKELTGDPGWGGVLAETAWTGQPVVLLFNPNQNLLPLYVEALSLLPPLSAWRVTFCTHFTELPDAIPCQWKGVIAGSEEARQLTKDVNNLILDLTAPMGEAPEGKYVDFARHGQEYLLPLEAEEHANTLANADTKPHEDAKKDTDKLEVSSVSPSQEVVPPPLPTIQLPKKRTGLSELFLRRTSRFQFYFLYSIMFILVLILLVLVIDQTSSNGILSILRHWNQIAEPVPDEPAPETDPQSIRDSNAETATATESELDQAAQSVMTETEDPLGILGEQREQQREPLLRLLEEFHVPECLAINFPTVQDNFIDVPEKRTFAELSPLHPFGAALELRFIPLFKLPKMMLHTRLNTDAFPDWVWQVEAIDTETQERAPMFLFQLKESGLEMAWQLEGLNPSYLYDTVLSSLGFLQLSVAGVQESTVQIPLFVPEQTEPIKVSDLSGLFEAETRESAVDLPFASELWERIFSEMEPPRTLLLEVQAEPAGDWVRLEPLSPSEVQANIRTSQQAGKPTESGETFENIAISFVATASLEKVVWKAGEYAGQLQAEQETVKSTKAELGNKIEQVKTKIFDNRATETDRNERERYERELRTCDIRLKEIESILAKLPEAYKEIGQNETARFHYSVFLEPADGERKLLILTTVRKQTDGF